MLQEEFALAGTCLGSLHSELHWQSVLPDTEMPKSLQKLLHSGNKESMSEMVKAAKDARDNILSLNNDYSGHYNPPVFSATKSNYGRINKDMYFFEKDLQPGRKIEALQLQKTAISSISFLPSQVAEKTPFSSNKFSEILKHFSVKTRSVEASIMKETIKVCEEPAVGGEEKFCATSLESLVDMAVSKLGQGVQILSSEVKKETESKKFTILKGVKLMGEKKVVCHKMKYPYAVFYCHSIEKTAVYEVPMVGSDGTRARAVAACHKDTSSWNPNHLAFQILKVEPGSVPICHFLFRETLVWIRKN